MKAHPAITCLFVAAASSTGTRAFASDTERAPTFGFEASIGGGVVGFTQKKSSEVAPIGASWSLRVVGGTRSYLAGEVAYVGTVQKLSMEGAVEGSLLFSRGIEFLLRFNVIDLGRWQPHVFAGLAYRLYDVFAEGLDSARLRSDAVGEVPLGGGIAFRYGGFVADARLEYRPAFNNDLMGERDRFENALHSWGVNAQIGWEL